MMKRTMGWGAVAMASIGTIALLASEAPSLPTCLRQPPARSLV